jgi:hypothetical protein
LFICPSIWFVRIVCQQGETFGVCIYTINKHFGAAWLIALAKLYC